MQSWVVGGQAHERDLGLAATAMQGALIRGEVVQLHLFSEGRAVDIGALDRLATGRGWATEGHTGGNHVGVLADAHGSGVGASSQR